MEKIVTIGGIDPLKLSEGILNLMLKKSIITQEEGQAVIDAATQGK